MKLLHITKNKNINSIIDNGLLPSYIENDSHWEVFQKYLNNRFCIYLWNAETYKNEKFIKDMIYTKMFIHPRNNLINQREIELKIQGLDIYDEDNYPDFRKIGRGLIGDSTSYSILEIDYDNIETYGMWKHTQEPGDDKFSTTTIMDDKYAHDDKDILICSDPIKFSNIKIVGEVLLRKYKNNTLGFTFRKN